MVQYLKKSLIVSKHRHQKKMKNLSMILIFWIALVTTAYGIISRLLTSSEIISGDNLVDENQKSQPVSSNPAISRILHTDILPPFANQIVQGRRKDLDISSMTTKGPFIGRKSHTSVIDSRTGSIYVLGGTSSTGDDLNDVWVLGASTGIY